MGKGSGYRRSRDRGQEATRGKSRKRVGFRVRASTARPSNTSIGDLMANGRYTEAVLEFSKATKIGPWLRRVLCIEGDVYRFPSLSLPFFY